MTDAVGPQVVCPGQVLLPLPDNGQVRLGPGLVTDEHNIMATQTGILLQNKSKHMWLESRQKRYIPAEGEVVVGTVVDRMGENFIVDIGAPFLAQLPQLSFEGATRRNRPAIKPGDLVYARVLAAFRDAEPILSCVDNLGRAAGFGHLKDGLLLKINTSLARKLLSNPPPAVLEALGSHVQFELAVGLNGRVWVCAPADKEDPAAATRTAIRVGHAIVRTEYLTDTQTRTFVDRILNS